MHPDILIQNATNIFVFAIGRAYNNTYKTYRNITNISHVSY